MLRFKKNLIYQIPMKLDAFETSANVNYKWVQADENNIMHFFKNEVKRMQTFLSFLRKGFLGIIIYDERGWISYGWVSTPNTKGPTHFSNRIKNKEVCWLFYSRTKKEYRGLGIHKYSMYLRIKLLERLQSKRNLEIYTDTSIDNIPSRSGMLRLGFIESGIVRTYSISFWRILLFRFSIWNKSEDHPTYGKGE